jgi:hypothetical protein
VESAERRAGLTAKACKRAGPGCDRRGTASDEIGSVAQRSFRHSLALRMWRSVPQPRPARRGRRARSCLMLKRKISRRACGSGAWRCHAGFGWARPSQDFARTSGLSKLQKPATGRGYRSGRPRKRGRRTDNTGRAENGFRRTRVAGLEPRTARRSRLVGSPTRCCTSSCSSGPWRGFSEICGFRSAVMRPLPAVFCAGDPGRSRSIHNPACVLSIPLADSDPRSLDAV